MIQAHCDFVIYKNNRLSVIEDVFLRIQVCVTVSDSLFETGALSVITSLFCRVDMSVKQQGVYAKSELLSPDENRIVEQMYAPKREVRSGKSLFSLEELSSELNN